MQVLGGKDIRLIVLSRLLTEWNDTEKRYPNKQKIHQLFEEQSEKVPEKIAITYGTQQLSYRELNARANQLAHHIKGLGVGSNVPVAVAMDRSLDMVITLLAILKAGGVYVPLDLDYPEERLDYILKDTRARVLLTTSNFAKHFCSFEGNVLSLDEERERISCNPPDNLQQIISSHDLVYIIYTSGTTGKPKGVGNTHQGLLNRLLWTHDCYRIASGDSFLYIASMGFDIAVWEILFPLTGGASLIVPFEKDKKDIHALIKIIDRWKVTNIHFVPSYLSLFIDSIKGHEGQSLRQIITGGEAVLNELKLKCMSALKNTELYLAYGPTEAAISVTHADCKEAGHTNKTSIGTPIFNTQIHILDADLNPVCIGEIGEIFIGGDSLARGYVNKPGLTAEKFIANPFSSKPGERLYRTGDLARYLPDGNIEFMGREDHQVKIRGFRIELGEIESTILSVDGVKQVIVLAREDEPGQKKLVAYVVPKITALVNQEGSTEHHNFITNIRQKCSNALPDYMSPNQILLLSEMPLTQNGKIDRKALPKPEGREGLEEYQAPEGETEKNLVSLWQKLLKLERVGRNDNFFHLGGDSIVAIHMVSAARKLGIYFDVKQIFVTPTIAGIAANTKTQDQTENSMHGMGGCISLLSLQNEIGSLCDQDNIQDIYPIGPLQSGLIFQYQLNPDSDAYFAQELFEIKNLADVQLFKEAWKNVIERYECLRSSFAYKTLQPPVQIIHHSVDIPWRELDISGLSEEEQDKAVDHILKQERLESFDIQTPPLFRFNLLRKSVNNFYLIWNQHHLLTDGWSVQIILNEVTKTYKSLLNDAPLNLRKRRSYKDYIAWLNKQNPSQAMDYWKKELCDISPTKIGTEVAKKATYIREVFSLTESQTNIITHFAREAGVTLNTVFQAVWSLILSQHTRQKDVTFGVTLSGRSIPLSGIEDMVGVFINTVPFRVKIKPHESLQDFFQRIQNVISAHQDNAYLPLSEILSTTERDLFDSLFVFQNYPIEESDQTCTENLDNAFNLKSIKFIEKIEYPIGIKVCPGKQICIHLHYQDSYFIPGKINNIKQSIISLCEHLQSPNLAIGNLLSISKDTETKFAHWNDTKTDFPEEKRIYELFEKQVEKTPNNIAAVYEEQKLTYKQLNEKANQLAHYLISLGVTPDTPVAISVESPLQMVIGFFGIVKAGGVYIPLDPNHPEKRLESMLEDMNAPILLTQTNLRNKFSKFEDTIVLLDKEIDKIANLSTFNPSICVLPSNLAYIIFTSGSTGKPNGVMVGHKQLVNVINSLSDLTALEPGDSFLQNVPFSFDPSLWSTIWPLTQGGYIILLDYLKLRDSEHILKLISDNSVKVLNIGPTMFRSLISMAAIKDCKTITHIIGGGEEWKNKDLEDLREKLPSCHFSNAYGPTETTIQVLTWTCKEKLKPLPTIPLGKPIANTQVYVLDASLNQIPVGLIGELFIGGVGLARGYINKPGLTAEKFIANPFSKIPGERLYKTGDLARYLPDGNIEFLGRIDDQVKIRGSRVELGEIELALSQHSDVKEAVVVAREDQPGNKMLVAYIMPQDGVLDRLEQNSLLPFSSHEKFVVLSGDALSALTEVLRDHLAQSLPEYMVPSYFIFLNKMPLMPNGKTDRKALPATDLSLEYSGEKYVAPTTQAQQDLVKIWSEVLNVQKIGIHDNFFRIGGHSLLATQIISRVRSTYNVDLSLRSFFDHPTIYALSQDIEHLEARDLSDETSHILVQQRPETLPLSFAQQRLWLLDQLIPGKALYNIPAAFRLIGNLNLQILEDAFNALIARHEVLRTIFPVEKEEAYQLILPHLNLRMSENLTDLSTLQETQQRTSVENLISEEAFTPFNLASGPLIRLKLFKLSSNEHILLLNMHHIISDGWSMGIFFKELSALYNAYSEGINPELPALPFQYADFALWQRDRLQGEILESQLSYWKKQLAGIPDLLELPTDKPRPKELTYQGASYEFTFSKDIKEGLNKLSQEHQTSVFMTLLAALQVLLYRYTDQKDIVIGSPIANRRYKETEALIGFFVNTLALRTTFEGNETFKDVLLKVKETTLQAHQHQDVPFEQLVDHLNITRALNHNPVFQVMFTFLNVEDWGGVNFKNISSQSLLSSHPAAKFDLSINAYEDHNDIGINIDYSTDLFSKTTIERFVAHFEKLLRDMLNNPAEQISEVSLLTSNEEQQLLIEWNDTKKDYPFDKLTHELFEEQVIKSPDSIALIFENQKLTYKELNEKANQLAHYLRKKGVRTDTLVAIAVERSLEMIISLLGILKAGGAYVPLDPSYPLERLQFMLSDTKAPFLITQSHFKNQFEGSSEQVFSVHFNLKDKELFVEEESTKELVCLSKESSNNPCIISSPLNLAYVIYTSGSTGKPKGVMINHSNLNNLLSEFKKEINIQPSDLFLAVTTFTFDISGLEFYAPLLTGATLLVASKTETTDPGQLSELIKLYNPTIMQATPSTWEMLLDSNWKGKRDLRVLCGGEALSSQLINALVKRTGRMWNVYGPTETTIWSSHKTYSDPKTSLVSLGHPIANTEIYILDSEMNPVPVGVTGEKYIGGAGLARGYLNRPELTAEKFIPNPFANEQTLKEGKSLRLYRTGDLARYLPDGTIEFLGRIDDQVKVRGFRIELGEIESILAQHSDVRQAVVVAREDKPGDKKLVAYVLPEENFLHSLSKESRFTSASQQECSILSGDTLLSVTEDLQNHLARSLPDYMVPSFFVFLDKIPLSPNGKIDRKSLPSPNFVRDGNSYVAPRNETESKICAIWEDVLGLPDKSIGIHDDFFKSGGNSLLAIKIVSRINTKFTRQITLQDVIKHNSVNQISSLFEETPDTLEYGEI